MEVVLVFRELVIFFGVYIKIVFCGVIVLFFIYVELFLYLYYIVICEMCSFEIVLFVVFFNGF